MHITDVTTTRLYCPFPSTIANARGALSGRDVLLVTVHTDEGLTGLSFLTGLHVAGSGEIATIETALRRALQPLVVGLNPLDTAAAWEQMYRGTVRFGRRGAVIRALSGIDLALWDLKGKVANLPVFHLIGGFRRRVPAYASGGYYYGENDLERLVAEMRGYVEQGFQAVKMKVGGASLARDTERVAAVRDAIGPEVELMLDANEAWDSNAAIRAADRWERFEIAWLEEPVAADDVPGAARLAAATHIPIALGENEYTRDGFRELIERGAASVLQADVTRVGGVTEWLRIAHMAAGWGIKMAPHAIQEIHPQLVGAVSNGSWVEFFSPEHYLQQFLSRLFVKPAEAREPEKGELRVPLKPGLGLEVDPELVGTHAACDD